MSGGSLELFIILYIINKKYQKKRKLNFFFNIYNYFKKIKKYSKNFRKDYNYVRHAQNSSDYECLADDKSCIVNIDDYGNLCCFNCGYIFSPADTFYKVVSNKKSKHRKSALTEKQIEKKLVESLDALEINKKNIESLDIPEFKNKNIESIDTSEINEKDNIIIDSNKENLKYINIDTKINIDGTTVEYNFNTEVTQNSFDISFDITLGKTRMNSNIKITKNL